MKFVSVIIMLMFCYGCSTAPNISGSNVMLIPSEDGNITTSAAQISIHLQTPNMEYKEIALLTASAIISSYDKAAQVETQLLEELRTQASLTGADGVTDIVREIMLGDKVITTTKWGTVHRPDLRAFERKSGLTTGTSQRNQFISTEYLVIYRGKAILTTTSAE